MRCIDFDFEKHYSCLSCDFSFLILKKEKLDGGLTKMNLLSIT